jgi:phosphatidylinositol alpha 1,6-mannosyltransferase
MTASHAPRVAFFTDSYYEANGVSTFSHEFESFARRRQIPLLSVHSGSETRVMRTEHLTTLELRRGPLAFPLDPELRCDPFIVRFKRWAFDEVRGFEPSLVQITSPSDIGILGAWAAHELRVPLVASWHTNLHEYAARRVDHFLRFLPRSRRSRIARVVERRSLDALLRFYGMAGMLMTPNPELARFLRHRTGKPVRLMAHGVNTEAFRPAQDARKGRAFTLGYVGRLTPEKNVRALAAIEQALVRRGVRDYRFLVVGGGSDEIWLRTHLRQADLAGILRGPALSHAFASMDVFLFPSTTDTFGLVILEAMASGVPGIVSPYGGPRNQICLGLNGFVADGPDEFAALIEALKNDPAMHARMRQHACEYAATCSWDNVFEQIYRSYDEFLSSTSGL